MVVGVQVTPDASGVFAMLVETEDVKIDNWEAGNGISITQKRSTCDYAGLALAAAYCLLIAIGGSVVASTSGSRFIPIALAGFLLFAFFIAKMVYNPSFHAGQSEIQIPGPFGHIKIPHNDVISIRRFQEDKSQDQGVIVKHRGGEEVILGGLSDESASEAVRMIAIARCHMRTMEAYADFEALAATELVGGVVPDLHGRDESVSSPK